MEQLREFNFSTEELCITTEIPPFNIIDKIWKYHIIPMQKVRDILQQPIIASENSGYRPYAWEVKQGRSGNSQHCFRTMGAVDWTTVDLSYLDSLQELIIRYTPYTRIARYQSFLHCDYKAQDGKRYLFTSTPDSNWTLVDVV